MLVSLLTKSLSQGWGAHNSVATLACHFAHVKAGMSPMWGVTGDGEVDVDGDVVVVYDDDGDFNDDDDYIQV